MQRHGSRALRTVLACVTVMALAFGGGCGGGSGGGSASPDGSLGAGVSDPQFGLNFIRFFWDKPGHEPADVFSLLSELDPQAIRQLHKGGVKWSTVEPNPGQWDFSLSDQVVPVSPHTPILRLFGLYWQSPTAPWDTVLVPTMTADCEDYIRTVVRRYRDSVRYWELGNEMERWRYFDPGNSLPSYINPPHFDASAGFSTAQQGAFLAATAAIVREEDPDAVILLPGLSGLDGWSQQWLAGVVAAAGSDWFDVVNYHFYGPWQDFLAEREAFESFLASLGIDDKPVWMTETGCTSDPSLPIRTNYPNSETEQAADVFRRALLAYGWGERYVGWHTLEAGDGSNPNDSWRLYGLVLDDAAKTRQTAFWSYQLFRRELIPFASVERLTDTASPQHLYRIVRSDGAVRVVAWGTGSVTVTDPVTEQISVVDAQNGQWIAVSAPLTLTLTDIPVLLR